MGAHSELLRSTQMGQRFRGERPCRATSSALVQEGFLEGDDPRTAASREAAALEGERQENRATVVDQTLSLLFVVIVDAIY